MRLRVSSQNQQQKELNNSLESNTTLNEPKQEPFTNQDDSLNSFSNADGLTSVCYWLLLFTLI
jgi:hypothetical protein